MIRRTTPHIIQRHGVPLRPRNSVTPHMTMVRALYNVVTTSPLPTVVVLGVAAVGLNFAGSLLSQFAKRGERDENAATLGPIARGYAARWKCGLRATKVACFPMAAAGAGLSLATLLFGASGWPYVGVFVVMLASMWRNVTSHPSLSRGDFNLDWLPRVLVAHHELITMLTELEPRTDVTTDRQGAAQKIAAAKKLTKISTGELCTRLEIAYQNKEFAKLDAYAEKLMKNHNTLAALYSAEIVYSF